MGIRINGFPEVTELKEDDKFIVDGLTGGTKSIGKDKVKELLGGGGGNLFKRIFQAELVATSESSVTLILPLKITGCNSTEGPEDKSETSEYLLPGDVFFTYITKGPDFDASRPCKPQTFWIESTKEARRFAWSGIPYVIASPYVTGELESTNVMEYPSVGRRNNIPMVSYRFDLNTSSYNTCKSGEKLFCILLYNGFSPQAYYDKMLFTDLTDLGSGVANEVQVAKTNAIYRHKLNYIGDMTYGSTIYLIYHNLGGNPNTKGSYLVYVDERTSDHSMYQSFLYMLKAGNRGMAKYLIFGSGTAHHKIELNTTNGYPQISLTGSSNNYKYLNVTVFWVEDTDNIA